jgi:hypothetical protein
LYGELDVLSGGLEASSGAWKSFMELSKTFIPEYLLSFISNKFYFEFLHILILVKKKLVLDPDLDSSKGLILIAKLDIS